MMHGANNAIRRWSKVSYCTNPEMTVVVGRFQTPYLHQAHKILLNEALMKAQKTVLILIGTTGMNPTEKDPMNMYVRSCMIQDYIFSKNPKLNVVIDEIRDKPFSDEEWSKSLDSKIEEYLIYQQDKESVLLLGGRDSFIPYYNGKYSTYELPSLPNVSATEMRKQSHPRLYHDDKSKTAFRDGIIYGNKTRQYANIYTTVDIILTKEDPLLGKMILLGKKHGEQEWRLPGGFVDDTDSDLEFAARREVIEECGHIELTRPKYFMSTFVDDRRYKDVRDKVFTIVFTSDYMWGKVEAGDDLETVSWTALDELKKSDKKDWNIIEGHKQIIKKYVDKQ